MKKSNKSYRLLLEYLKEQRKGERYNEGLDFPLVFKIEKTENGDILMNGKPLNSKENEKYLEDLYEVGLDFDTVFEGEIPKEELEITEGDEIEVVSEEEFEKLKNNDCCVILSFDLTCLPFKDDNGNVIVREKTEKEEVVNNEKVVEEPEVKDPKSEIIKEIKELMKNKNEIKIVLNYNLYYHKKGIYVITPDRCTDRDLLYYGSDFLDMILDKIGIKSS